MPVRSAPARFGAGCGARRDDVHVRQQPADAGLDAGALRMELDLHRSIRWVRRWRGPSGRADDAQARQGSSRVLRSVLQRPADGRPRGAVPAGERSAPPWRHRMLSATGSRECHQIVLGAATMAQLHKHSARTSRSPSVSRPTRRSTSRRRVFGSSAPPPFPPSGSPARSLTTRPWASGVLLSHPGTCRRLRRLRIDGGPTPRSTARIWSWSGSDRVSRRRRGWPVSTGSWRAANRAFAAAPGGSAGNAIVVQGVQRPAEIVNYKTIGADADAPRVGAGAGRDRGAHTDSRRIGPPAPSGSSRCSRRSALSGAS